MHSHRDNRGHHHNDFSDASFSDSQRHFRDRKVQRGRGSREHRHGRHSSGGKPQYQHRDKRGEDGPRYCSRSEGACAILLERYVPGFKVQEGKSFQITIGQNHRGHSISVDFKIDGVFFEYHAVRFWRNSKSYGDFKDREQYREYRRTLNELPKHQRKAFTEETKQLLAQNYYDKKRAFLDASPETRESELIVAISPGEFYDKVIRRFGVDYPDKASFNTQFQKLLGEVVADYERGKPDDDRRGRRGKKK